MQEIKDVLIDILKKKDASRGRSTQTQVGPSELGGCPRKVWYRLNQQPETNSNELKLAAIMGTAIHGAIEQALAYEVKTVNLVGIPRDGDERDIKVHSEAYDPSIAEEALNWLRNIEFADEAPPPAKDASYCQFYCKYYDPSGEVGCTGLKKGGITPAEILLDDPQVDMNALEYLQVNNEIKKLETKSDSLKSTFEGIFGRTLSGVEISWTTVAPRQSVDEEQVKEKIGFVPKKTTGKESVRLNIKHTEEK